MACFPTALINMCRLPKDCGLFQETLWGVFFLINNKYSIKFFFNQN